MTLNKPVHLDKDLETFADGLVKARKFNYAVNAGLRIYRDALEGHPRDQAAQGGAVLTWAALEAMSAEEFNGVHERFILPLINSVADIKKWVDLKAQKSNTTRFEREILARAALNVLAARVVASDEQRQAWAAELVAYIRGPKDESQEPRPSAKPPD